jgi:hypothetical protein
MGPVSIVDYAMPLIRIEKLAREIHEACLNQKYMEANELNTLLLTESRVLAATLAIMDAEQHKGYK